MSAGCDLFLFIFFFFWSHHTKPETKSGSAQPSLISTTSSAPALYLYSTLYTILQLDSSDSCMATNCNFLPQTNLTPKNLIFNYHIRSLHPTTKRIHAGTQTQYKITDNRLSPSSCSCLPCLKFGLHGTVH